MIKMDNMVLDELRTKHDISDELRILWHVDLDRVLDRSNAGQGVDRRANAADAFDKCPRIARVAAL